MAEKSAAQIRTLMEIDAMFYYKLYCKIQVKYCIRWPFFLALVREKSHKRLQKIAQVAQVTVCCRSWSSLTKLITLHFIGCSLVRVLNVYSKVC